MILCFDFFDENHTVITTSVRKMTLYA